MTLAKVRDTSLWYERAGELGDPCVFVHGSLTDHSTWTAVTAALSGSLQTLAYDRRGYGRSANGPKPEAVRTDAEDLAALLDSVDLYPAHLVGHSYGAVVALRLASERPELVRSVVAHEPPFFGLLSEDPASESLAAAFAHGIRGLRAEVAKGAYDEAARQVVEVFSVAGGAWERLPVDVRTEFASRMRQWSDEYGDPAAFTPSVDTLEHVLIPVLLTFGALSPPFQRAIEERLAARLPNAQVRELAGVGHAPQVTRPLDFAGHLLTFLVERSTPVT